MLEVGARAVITQKKGGRGQGRGEVELKYLGGKFLLTKYKKQSSNQQTYSMTPVSKHNSKKKWECDNRIYSWINFFISTNTATTQIRDHH
jgi:hypothetical protein